MQWQEVEVEENILMSRFSKMESYFRCLAFLAATRGEPYFQKII